MSLLKRVSLFGFQSVNTTATGKWLQNAKRVERFTNILHSSEFHSTSVFPKSSVENEVSSQSQDQRQSSVIQQKGRQNRRKRPLTLLFKNKKQSVVSTACPLAEVNCVPIAEGLDIDAMCRDLDFTNFFILNYIDENKIAVHCQRKESKSRNLDDFFVFAEGVVVFWDVDRNSQNSITDLLSKYQHIPFASQLKDDEEETMAIDLTPGPSYASNDVVFLNSERHKNDEQTPDGTNSELERFAFSHAMAASVKMGIWERTLDELDDKVQLCIEGMKDRNNRWWNPLRRNGIPWTHKNALQMIGNFADLRHVVNSTDLLSKDIYWDLPEIESVYGSLARRLCLQSRRNLINERLGHCEYFSKTISEVINIEHSHFLEVVIILLIAFECTHVATNWLGFGDKQPQRQFNSTTQNI